MRRMMHRLNPPFPPPVDGCNAFVEGLGDGPAGC
ncbi:hypothetical protein M529_07765 [Sphingobium ummariense RL-3]|uniref:Uncharacterized protein n=1 Tax=Sphingobium ummariense RL-3 TaxID=1346791 RepID=T0IV72_9SPHN|nr:hypothetical protein M529_07765 [Sphingobium ummariense RL-3]